MQGTHGLFQAGRSPAGTSQTHVLGELGKVKCFHGHPTTGSLGHWPAHTTTAGDTEAVRSRPRGHMAEGASQTQLLAPGPQQLRPRNLSAEAAGNLGASTKGAPNLRASAKGAPNLGASAKGAPDLGASARAAP